MTTPDPIPNPINKKVNKLKNLGNPGAAITIYGKISELALKGIKDHLMLFIIVVFALFNITILSFMVMYSIHMGPPSTENANNISFSVLIVILAALDLAFIIFALSILVRREENKNRVRIEAENYNENYSAL